MKRTVELRVLVTTEDESAKADERIESSVRRALAQWFDPLNLYVEQAVKQ